MNCITFIPLKPTFQPHFEHITNSLETGLQQISSFTLLTNCWRFGCRSSPHCL